MLRGVQRDLRDHFTELAEQLNRSLKESLAGAERSLSTTRGETERRLTEIETELAKLERLQQRVRTLLPEEAAVTAPAPEPAPRPGVPVAAAR